MEICLKSLSGNIIYSNLNTKFVFYDHYFIRYTTITDDVAYYRDIESAFYEDDQIKIRFKNQVLFKIPINEKSKHLMIGSIVAYRNDIIDDLINE